MQTIYIDVLLILNIYVNFFLLKATARFLHTPLKIPRCILASLYGSLFSLMILAPDLGKVINLLIKLFAALTIIPVAFGFHGIKKLFSDSFMFLAVNFIFAGGVYAVYSWLKPDFMHIANSCIYIDFSMIVLITTTAILYFIICTAEKVIMKSRNIYDNCKVKIRYADNVIISEGIADTGNNLMDLFSGKHVVICGKDEFTRLTGNSKIPKGFRILPCNTVNGGGFISIFRPDEVVIINTVSGVEKNVDVMVGSGECGNKIIFNPTIL